MPTGYTAFIEDGQITNASDFLMLCARAFGACIDMKEESLSKPIPKEFKPATYCSEWAERERQKLVHYQNMSLDEAQQQCDLAYESEVKRRVEYKRTQIELLDRYQSILDDVKRWNPPTEDHVNLKRFAIDQIEMCLPDPEYYERQEVPQKQDAKEWLQEQIDNCKKSIERYTKEQEEENSRTAEKINGCRHYVIAYRHHGEL